MNQETIFTKHAYQRCQDREINPQLMETVIQKGISYYQTEGQILHRMSKGSGTRHRGKKTALVVVTDASAKIVITAWREHEQERNIKKGRPNPTSQRFHVPQNQLFGLFTEEDWESLQAH